MALTAKQRKFCENIVSGMSGKDAYINAYDTKASDQVIRNESNKLLSRDDITEHIEVLRKPLQNHFNNTVISEREQRKQLINERILDCVNRDDDAAIARYMDILNKMDGEYVNINKNIEEHTHDIQNVDTTTLLRLVE